MPLKKGRKDVASMAAEINADVDNNVATETAIAAPVAETVKPVVEEKKVSSSLSDLLTPSAKETKSGSLTLRVKPSVKKRFAEFCTEKGVSQPDMFEFWVNSIAK